MNMRDLIPWGRTGGRMPAPWREGGQDPFLTLHREMNRMFDDVLRGFDGPGGRGLASWGAWPSIEVADREKEIRVVAELPGLEEKDVEILLDHGVLTLRGEKTSEVEDRDRQFSERFQGRFERRIPIDEEIEEDKVTASFKNGVLTVVLPKSEKAQSSARRIAINGGQA
jgi:HSP20 family protein